MLKHAGLNASSRARAAGANVGYDDMRSRHSGQHIATPRRAEGYGRFHYLDNAKFCSNARGSCWEVLDHLITSCDEELLSEEFLLRGRELVASAIRLLNGYMAYLKRATSQ